MDNEPRIALADEASTQASEVVQVWDGLSALISIVTDTQKRLTKLEAERSTPHAIDHAIEEAIGGIDWDEHAENAMAECDASSYAQDAIEQASMDIDLSGQAEEAVDEAVTSGYVESAIETAVERIDVEKLVGDMLSNYRLDLVENID